MAESPFTTPVSIKKVTKQFTITLSAGAKGYSTVQFDSDAEDITSSKQIISEFFETGNIANTAGLQLTPIAYIKSTRTLYYQYYAPNVVPEATIEAIITYV